MATLLSRLKVCWSLRDALGYPKIAAILWAGLIVLSMWMRGCEPDSLP
jgi:hypothetical protein